MFVKSYRFIGRSFAAILASILLVVSLIPTYALAESADDADAPMAAQATLPASGTSGTCVWEIDADGNLVVRPTDGVSGELESSAPWKDYKRRIVSVSFSQGVKAASTHEMFEYCMRLSAVDLSGLDTSSVTDMSGMFFDCISLSTLDLSGLDTSSVTNMSNMFSRCTSLTSVNLSGLDTSSVTDMHSMFFNCSSLTSANLSGLDTSSVRYIGWMFYDCQKLTSLDLSGLDTSSVTSARDVFSGCSSLASVKVGPRTLANLELPTETVKGHADWYSKAASAWFTSEQISVQRWAIADTYAKSDGEAIDPAGTQAMYRLYNPNSGEHFYTASTIERDAVIATGWNDEGIGWTAPTQGIQVYRLYNSYAGEHHYTTSAEERDMLVGMGWTWEEGGWFSDPDKAVPLYRAYNPNAFANNHHYTTDWGEFQTLLGLGWQDEGVGWHGVK